MFKKRLLLLSATVILLGWTRYSSAQSGAWLSGRVADQGGAAIPQARVTIHTSETTPLHFTTDYTGGFGFFAIPGRYVVDVMATSFKPIQESGVEFAGRTEADIRLHFAGCTSCDGMPVAADGTVRLHGEVVDGTGNVVVDKPVRIEDTKGKPYALATTDREGQFVFQGKPGAYTVRINYPSKSGEIGNSITNTLFRPETSVKVVVSGIECEEDCLGLPPSVATTETSSSSLLPAADMPALPSATNFHQSPVSEAANASWEYGFQVSGGIGLQDRSDFSFFNAGVHAGKVLTENYGNGLLRANFEYGVEVLPLWQSYTPKFQRLNCPAGASVASQCYGPTTTGGTYRGVSIVPIILRINFTHGERIMPWVQGAGGVLYTTRKYPGVGNLNVGDPTQTGPAADTSVWNFTPQGGIGMHYFVKPRRSLDFSANAVHISSASLGDKNPGVNDSLQFAVGYSWWK